MNDEAKTKEALIEELRTMRSRLEVLEDAASRRASADVTVERQRIERELRQQEQRLHLIVEGVRDHAISMLDPDGRIITFNRAAQQIKGHALEDVRGQHFGIFFTPEDRASGLPELELRTAREQGRYEGEGWRERKDGSRFYAAVSLSRLQDDSGEPVGFVKVTQDRTRYRKLSKALERRESELRLILDAIPGLVAYMSPDERYRQVNRAYEEWFGRPAAELIGKHISDALGPQAYETVRPHVAAVLAGQAVSFESEVPYASGGARWVSAQYIPDRDTNGNIQGYVSLVLDVTDAKRAEERLAEEARINETLYRVGTALAQDLDLDTVFARLTDEATALCRAQFGAFFYNVDDPERGQYMLYTLAGVPSEKFAGFPMPRNTEVFAPTFAGDGVVRSDDITKDSRYGKSAPYHGMPAGHLPVCSYLAVPVVSRAGEVHGGLFFGHAEAAVFTERDERMIVAIAAQAAVAIDNARLHAASITAEQQYRALAESSPQLVWTTTPDGRVEYCNPQFLAYVGLSLEEMRSEPKWHVLVHAEDMAQATDAWTRALATGEPYEVEYRFRRASDGSYRWFLARGACVRDGEGRIVRWVGSCTDIDDHKRSEETHRFLAEAGALLASSLDHRQTLPALARLAVPHMADWCSIQLLDSKDALERVAVAHADPHRLEVIREIEHQYPADENDAARRIVRTGVSEHVHELTDAMLVASSRDLHHLELMRLLALRSWMAVPIKVDRRTIGVLSLASSESGRLFEQRDVDIAEEIGRRVGASIDNARLFEMTQLARRRAEEASRAKDELLGVTSHELRTPLSAILGWVRMLRSGHLTDDKRERALETIERNVKIQVQLVEDLLDFNRVITGKLRLALAPLEPADVVEAAVEVIRPAAEAKNVRLQVLLDPDAGILNGDAERLQQVVWNLLSNAVKFTPKEGRVYIRMQREDSHVEIVVADTGAGIAATFLPHVFQPFRQQDATATRSHGGLGLGLAIVKHLVELHGGSIEARSDGVGKGATFVVRLPVSPLRSSSMPPLATPVSRRGEAHALLQCPPELEGLRVLVCEDEPDARELLESILTGCKARVTLAGSVAEALDRFSEHIPDVVISDIGMPEASGYDLIRRIRALPAEKGGRVPAVALTAYASMADRTRALMEGFQNHVAKPTEPQELLAAVAALAGKFNRP
ncbi:MAG: PAS domain S-box protein [Myxococcales bacterium]|nr:MAG: PAS domain S-box protein [Myxococcales bacterium]